MSDNTYNGWKNYETWAVAIWLDTQQNSHFFWCDQARRHRKDSRCCQQVVDGTWTEEDAAKYHLADQLKDEITEGAPQEFQGAYSDLLDAALGDVNWEEIAAHFLQHSAPNDSPFGPIIFSYTRAQAIADGVLVDVCKMAAEAGIKYHTVLTPAVWQEYVVVPEGVDGQDEHGRLWDIIPSTRLCRVDSVFNRILGTAIDSSSADLA